MSNAITGRDQGLAQELIRAYEEINGMLSFCSAISVGEEAR